MNDNFQNTKNAIISYFRGVKTEWGKITWPEKHQVVVETFFVVAIVFVFTVFIYFVSVFFFKDETDKNKVRHLIIRMVFTVKRVYAFTYFI